MIGANHPLRLWRKAQEPKITQTALAGRVAVEPSHISQIENGKRVPSLSLAAEIERATEGEVKAAALAPERAA